MDMKRRGKGHRKFKTEPVGRPGGKKVQRDGGPNMLAQGTELRSMSGKSQ